MASTPLEQAIDSASGGDWRLMLSMRLGALLEGGSLTGPWPSGDQGRSHGPFQIFSAVHDVTYEQANDPTFAVGYMLDSYRAGVARVERERPGLFTSDPAAAAALAAYYAEKPREMYPAERVAAKFSTLKLWLVGIGKTVAGGVDTGPLGGLGGGALGGALDQLGDPQLWRRVAAVILGALLILAGVQLVLWDAGDAALGVVEAVT